MNKKMILVCTVSGILASATQAQDLNARLIAYKDCHPDAEALQFPVKPTQCGPFDQGLTFLIEGQNIAVVDKDSLVVSKLEVRGEDARFKRNGEPAYEPTPNPKVDDDGAHATFSVFLDSAPFGSIAAASFEGTVDVITSSKLVVKEQAGLSMTETFEIVAGPVTVSNRTSLESPIPASYSEEQRERVETRRREREEKYLQLYVTGNLDAFVSVELVANGEVVAHRITSNQPEERMLAFPRPATATVDLAIRYWDGLERVTVPLKI